MNIEKNENKVGIMFGQNFENLQRCAGKQTWGGFVFTPSTSKDSLCWGFFGNWGGVRRWKEILCAGAEVYNSMHRNVAALRFLPL